MNSKLEKVNPIVETAQYVRGTEAGNFYLIQADNGKAIVGFRPLAVKVPALGSKPQANVSTRVRIVPVVDNSKLQALLQRFGFERKNGGSNPPHYSQVTNNAPATVADAVLAISLIA